MDAPVAPAPARHCSTCRFGFSNYHDPMPSPEGTPCQSCKTPGYTKWEATTAPTAKAEVCPTCRCELEYCWCAGPKPHPTLPGKSVLETVLEDMEKVRAVTDMVHRPAHYARFKVEPIYFIGENELGFLEGNVVKYVLRHDAKNGVEDLKKARRYLDMLIAKKEGDPAWSE